MSDHKITIHDIEVDLGEHHENHELARFIGNMSKEEIHGLDTTARHGGHATFTAHVNGGDTKFRLASDGKIHKI